MKILIKASCSNEMNWCRHALVELDQEAIDRLLARRELLAFAYNEDSDLSEMIFSEFPGRFYDNVDVDSLLTERQQEEFDREDYLLMPDEFDVDDDPARTECDELVVRDNGFFWKAIPKHTDLRVETSQLSYDVLWQSKVKS